MGHSDATFYHRIGWKRIIEKSFGHSTYYLMASEGPIIVGVLPIVHLKSMLFGSIMCSMPFLNFGGICANNSEAKSTLLSKAKDLLQEHRADYLELRHFNQTGSGLPCKTNKISMTVALNHDPEVLWNKFATKHRTTIRRAAKNELEIIRGKGDILTEFFTLLNHGWKELGTPLYSRSFFENILETFPDSIEIYLVLHKGTPVAGAFNGLFNGTVEGMWASSPRSYVKLQANYFLYWEMVRQACIDGHKSFHLGRSSADSGAAFYKEKWNAIPGQLYWEYLLNENQKLPELNVDNPRYRSAIKLWRALPMGITTVMGPGIAKSIP